MKTVYILRSLSSPDRYYIGQSNHLNVRLIEHNKALSGYASKFAPWKLMVAMQFRDPTSAFQFERYLKTGSGRAFCKRHFQLPSPDPHRAEALTDSLKQEPESEGGQTEPI